MISRPEVHSEVFHGTSDAMTGAISFRPCVFQHGSFIGGPRVLQHGPDIFLIDSASYRCLLYSGSCVSSFLRQWS